MAGRPGEAPGDLCAWQAAASWVDNGRRSVFLQDADSLVIGASDLIAILSHLAEKFPGVPRVTSYARSSTVARMESQDLQALREAGLNRLHIGLESGANEVHVRVLTVDRVDLGEAEKLVLRDRILDELVGRQRERVLLLAGLGEGAELALHAADVRLVQVDVLDEVDLVAAAALPAREVGELAEREQIVRLHQGDAVVEVEPLAGEHLVSDRRERIELQNRHVRTTSPGRRLRASGPRARLCAARRRDVPWPA